MDHKLVSLTHQAVPNLNAHLLLSICSLEMKVFLGCKRRFARILLFCFIASHSVFFNGCDDVYFSESETFQGSQQKASELRILVLDLEPSFSRRAHPYLKGVDYELLSQFASEFHFSPRFIVKKNEAQIIEALKKGEGDMAAARFHLKEKDSSQVLGQDSDMYYLGPDIEESAAGLFCHKRLIRSKLQASTDSSRKPMTIGITKQDIGAISKEAIQAVVQSENINIKVQEEFSSVKLLTEFLKRKSLDCIVVDQWTGQARVAGVKGVDVMAVAPQKHGIHWLVSKSNLELQKMLKIWFRRATRADQILSVIDRYRAPITSLSEVDIRKFLERKQQVLPYFRDAFQNAAMLFELPWQLIAAVSYQESMWDTDAVSPTGVRGIMQLTKETEEFLGIRNRRDPLDSIWGGAKYIQFIHGRIAKEAKSELTPEDHLSLTLAAYNMGLGHLRDAQKLARRKGKNPQTWRGVKSVLPLLSKSEMVADLDFGLARGQEAMTYVERVRGFWLFLNN